MGENTKSVRQNLPSCPSTPATSASENIRQYDIELITPLFGGGTLTRVNDHDFPIRPTAIRGQLQFWWRATVGAQYEKKEDLRTAQSAVWGDTTRASPVQVRVDVDKMSVSAPVPCARYELDSKNSGKFRSRPFWNNLFNSNDSALPYALFPFQGRLTSERSSIEEDPASSIHNAKFQLIVSWTKDIDFAKQVEPAIWAWVNFGGLGSRTRRGCGAILCKQLAPRDAEDLKSAWQRFMPELFPEKEWPTLAERLLTGQAPSTAMNAWNSVISEFRDFRQGEGIGRNQGQQQNRPGRSRYPEAETIRKITGKRSYRHPQQKHIPTDAFPRAAFGLPIVFHFQGEGEPPDTVLYPGNEAGQKGERMSSPLILKPLALQSGNAIPLILQLSVPELVEVALLQGKRPDPLLSTTVITDSRLADYPDSPLAGSAKGSAIEAFLDYVSYNNFVEVER